MKRKDTRRTRSPARQRAKDDSNRRTRVIPATIFPAVDRAIDLVRSNPERAVEVNTVLEGVFIRDGGGPNTE